MAYNPGKRFFLLCPLSPQPRTDAMCPPQALRVKPSFCTYSLSSVGIPGTGGVVHVPACLELMFWPRRQAANAYTSKQIMWRAGASVGKRNKQGRYLSQASEHEGRTAGSRVLTPGPALQLCDLSVAAFTPQGQNQVAVRDPVAHKPKIFTTWPFAEKVRHLGLVS